MKKSDLVLVPVALWGLAACGQQPDRAPEGAGIGAGTGAQRAVTVLPALETKNATAFVREGGALVPLVFGVEGAIQVAGTVTGDGAPVYAVPVAQGQTLTVDFRSDSPNLYVNVIDAADHSGAALYRGEVEGRQARLEAARDMTFVITPFQPRAMAHRNETADFTLKVTRQ